VEKKKKKTSLFNKRMFKGMGAEGDDSSEVTGHKKRTDIH